MIMMMMMITSYDYDSDLPYLAKSSELGRRNPKDDAGVEDKEMCRAKVLHVCTIRIIIQLNVRFPNLRLAKVDLFQPSVLTWLPGQILIRPVQPHPPIHLKNRNLLIKVEVYERHS